MKYAFKSIQKAKVLNIAHIQQEIHFLKLLDHPNIIKIYDAYEDEKNIHLVQDLCTGGKLFERIINSTENQSHFTEHDAALLIRNILEPIEYLHTVHKICHLNITPEKILFLDNSPESTLKLLDFEQACYIDKVDLKGTW